jgi:hypothetical protein
MQTHWLTNSHLAQLPFLEVRFNPDLLERHDRHQRRTGCNPLADLHRATGNLPAERGRNLASLHRKPGFAIGRGRTLDIGMRGNSGALCEGKIARGLLPGDLQGGTGDSQRTAGRFDCRFGMLEILDPDRTACDQRRSTGKVVTGATELNLQAGLV